ncbi:Presequence protease 2, chloroplastic/mitochondrial [Stylosanthes scabra]|uniref:Presequence protease 2, chloroplastic/mitochondrial n=1 Tax=Stylosanthes scabra TaxID=79078 RepID=A0ABU6W9I4_9FABA|nr:Presequence protease 2, chloroplastic/mitochondrial [Stylosanthes scabra]
MAGRAEDLYDLLELRVDQDWVDISSSLEEIRKSVFSKQGCLINITADGKSLTNTKKSCGEICCPAA